MFNLPCVTFVTCQPKGGGGYKPRLIQCLPFSITCLETYFGHAITNYFLASKDSYYKIGKSQLDIQSIVLGARELHKCSSDYSKFDRSIPSIIMDLSFRILKEMLVLDDYKSKLFDTMKQYVLYGGVYHPVSGVIKRNRGIISGSYFTNIVDSICNLLMSHHVLASYDSSRYSLYVCGDDTFYTSKFRIPSGKCEKLFSLYFGVTNKFEPNKRYLPGDGRGYFLGSD